MIPFKENKEAPKNFWTWLNKRYDMNQKGRQDTVIAVVGGEQLGKSRWTLRTEWCLAKENFLDEKGKINTDKIVFDGENYRYQATHNKKSIIHDDEAITHFYSRRAMSDDNIKCNQVLAQCGFKHNIQFLLIPNFFVFDTYIREHRIHAIVHIYPNNKFKTWVFYRNDGSEKKKKLKEILKKKNFNVRPSSVGWWSEEENSPEFNEFVKQYRKKENIFKTKSGEKIQEQKEKPKSENQIKLETAIKARKELNLTQAQAAKIANVTRQTIAKYEKQNVTIIT